MASEGDNSRGGGGGGAKGDAPGRVREGETPPAQRGGMGERCELPHKNSKNYTKTRRPHKRPRPLFYMYTTKSPTKKTMAHV